MNGTWYCKVLEDKVIPSLEALHPGGRPIFQDDGAPCHRSALVVRKENELSIKRMPWVGQSPDCNPIENLWAYLKEKVKKLRPKTREELEEVVQNVWYNEIPATVLRNLALSMNRRMRSVIRSGGYPTAY